MNNLANTAHDAGRLLGFAVRCQNPATSKEYTELLRRYDEDPVLHEMVDGLCSGFGLRIIDTGKYGFIVTATEASPFRLNADDYKGGMTPDDRILHGIIQVAVAAYSFPRAETLAQDDDVQPARVTPPALAKYLRDFAEAENAKLADSPDREETEEKRAWRVVLAQALTKETAGKRESARSLTGMCRYALEYLETHGLMRVVDEKKGLYQGTSAYRIRLKYHGAHALLEQLRAFTAQRAASNGPEGPA